MCIIKWTDIDKVTNKVVKEGFLRSPWNQNKVITFDSIEQAEPEFNLCKSVGAKDFPNRIFELKKVNKNNKILLT